MKAAPHARACPVTTGMKAVLPGSMSAQQHPFLKEMWVSKGCNPGFHNLFITYFLSTSSYVNKGHQRPDWKSFSTRLKLQELLFIRLLLTLTCCCTPSERRACMRVLRMVTGREEAMRSGRTSVLHTVLWIHTHTERFKQGLH